MKGAVGIERLEVMIREAKNSLRKVFVESKHKLFLVVYSLVFGILFINIFVPYNIDRWYGDSGISRFLRLSSYGAVAAAVIYLEHFLIRPFFKITLTNLYGLIKFSAIELLLISVIFSFLYNGADFTPKGVAYEYLHTMLLLLPILVLTYGSAFALIWIASQKKSVSKKAAADSPSISNHLFSVPDENGKVCFSVDFKDLLYIQSCDNYVLVFYLSNGKVKKEIVRNSLKSLEEKFVDTTLRRCHRSFMVNVANVEIMKRKSSIMVLKLKGVDEPIPVSRSFIPSFKFLLD